MVSGDAARSAMGVIAGSSLSIQIIHDRREVRLIPIGEIDVHSASTFAVAGEFAVAELPDHLHIDLSQVTFMDSSGVRGLQSVVASATAVGVSCTIIGHDFDGGDIDPTTRPMVVWSGSTTHSVTIPND